MSNGAPREPQTDRQGLAALETTVGRALEELRRLREQAAAAARRSAELEGLLATFHSGADSPDRMRVRLDQLEAENRDLRARVGHALQTVERLLARVQYLEHQK